MNDAGQPKADKELQLDGVIEEFRRRVANGEDVDRDKLIAKFPHLADELRAFFKSGALTTSLANADAPLSGLETLPPNPLTDSISEQPKAAKTPTPERFGKYEIVKVLGRGAMGVVYLARDSQLGRMVALKIPTRVSGESDESLRRFSREGKAAAVLNHPNICAVHEVDHVGETRYIAMQYIEGKPLSSFIAPNKPMDERNATVVVRKLALALSHAHQRGIIHRDLKPANVMIDERREPILTDFGLARQLNNAESVRVTQSGMLLGTPAYMSPEQVEGKIDAAGPASDIYSLGIIFYELLTGRIPFQGPIAAVLAQIAAKEPEKPSTIRPDLDRRLESICLRMMSKPIGKRFATMDEVADALARVLKAPAERSETDADELTRRTHAASQQVTVLTTSDAQTLYRRARKVFAAHDYEQAARLLEQVPAQFRDPQIEVLLEEATERNDEIHYLLAAVEDAESRQDYHGLLPTIERVLELKPGHRQAFAIYKNLSTGGDKSPSRSSRVKRPSTNAIPEYAKWIAVAGGTAVVVTFVMFAVMRRPAAPAVEQDVSKATKADGAKSQGLISPDKKAEVVKTEGVNSANAKLDNRETEGVRVKKIPVPSGRLKQIGLAFQAYHEMHGTLPLHASVDSKGGELLSWRVHLLPYLGEKRLYDQFHLDEPWNSPNNLPLVSRIHPVYKSPDYEGNGKTQIMVFTGEKTLFDKAKPAKFTDIADGLPTTLLAIEAAPMKAVEWTRPEDLEFKGFFSRAELGLPLNAVDGYQALMADGNVVVLSDSVPPQTVQAIITYNGNDGTPQLLENIIDGTLRTKPGKLLRPPAEEQTKPIDDAERSTAPASNDSVETKSPRPLIAPFRSKDR